MLCGRSVVGQVAQKLLQKGYTMLKAEILTLPVYNKFREKISEMNTMVFEELYRHYYNCDEAPYDYYNADNIISPRDEANHREYFAKVKPQAIELLELWLPALESIVAKDEGDLKRLDFIRRNIIGAEDMIDLVWYSTLMFKGVQSLYYQYNMKLDGSGNQCWRMPLVS